VSQQIHLAAIVVRDGQLLLHREHDDAAWQLPGGPLLPEHDDVDAGMDATLERIGISAPAIEEDFVETIHLPAGEGHIVYNIYAPTDWTGDPRAPGAQSSWFGLYELEALQMDGIVRDAVLAAFGLRERRDPAPEILAALGGGDPRPYSALMRDMPEFADSMLAPPIGQAGQGAALDRWTRSLLVMATCAALGRRESLPSHVGEALNHGATPEQIIETLELVSDYPGLPAAAEAWSAIEAVFAEHGIARPGRPQ
jgi:alkylhydroperoxidase/carboxymuconolactone decarboxylase family protein YurZ